MPRKVLGTRQKHLTVWLYPNEWEKINKLAAPSGMSVSLYVCTKLLKYIEKNGYSAPAQIERDSSKKGHVRPFSFEETSYNTIKAAHNAIKDEMNFSSYLVSVVLA